jgi:hypothetical protein
MSLAIFIDRGQQRVGIVRWFRDPKFNIDYASGSYHEMPYNEFRQNGLDWIQKHFAEYERTRLPESEIVKVFLPGEGKKKLKDRISIFLWTDTDKLWLAPIRIQKYDSLLFEDLGRDKHRSVGRDCTPEEFWSAFEHALALAE